MKRHVKRWYCSAVLAVLVSCTLGVVAGVAPVKNDLAKPLLPKVLEAWRGAGAVVGWMKDMPPQTGAYEFWEPWRDKEESGAMPAFRFPERDAGGVLAKLPEPETVFGLDFHCGFYAGVKLKELGKLRHLQSLSIGGVQGEAYADLKDLSRLTNLRGLYLFYLPVTDAQLKHVAGLKNLQALDLSHTQVTDMGLKELAGLNNLKWLNLRSTEVTAIGVAALQKDLPNARITTGD